MAGDGAKRDEEGYYWLLGRIDDVMNVAGHRLSTYEIESALVDNPKVAEAAVVSRPDDLVGEAIVAFVTLKSGFEGTDEVAKELREHVSNKIGKIARPHGIIFTADLPKTRSGKIMRRLLRDVAQGRTLGDVTTLANAEIVDQIHTMVESGAGAPTSNRGRRPRDERESRGARGGSTTRTGTPSAGSVLGSARLIEDGPSGMAGASALERFRRYKGKRRSFPAGPRGRGHDRSGINEG